MQQINSKQTINLVFCLGNIGKEYVNTRHNVGFNFFESLENILSNLGFIPIIHNNKFYSILYFEKDNLSIAKPNNFMNNSGVALRKIIKERFNNSFDLSSLLIVHDDLDIKLGEYKIQYAKGPKDHNGLISVENSLKSSDFWRLRIGIDNRSEHTKSTGSDYVLDRFSSLELKLVNDSIRMILSKEFSFNN